MNFGFLTECYVRRGKSHAQAYADTFAQVDAAEAMGEGTGYGSRLVIHGIGAGEDSPLITGPVGEEIRAVKLRANNVHILKPAVTMAEPRRQINWGDTVVVREHGAERLGKRPQAFSVSA